MKIAYLFLENVNEESGVTKKIQSQMSAWQKRGAQICIVSKVNPPDMWEGIRELPIKKILFKEGIQDAEFDEFNPDLVYSRHYLLTQSTNKYLNNKLKVIVEINSDIKMESKSRLRMAGRLKYPYLLFRKYIPQMLKASKTISSAKGFVFVSNELTTRYRTGNKPYCVIANGINLSEYSILPIPENDCPRLAFIGSPGLPWHGVHKIVDMAKHFPTWHFDIIGYKPEDLEGEKPANMHFYGLLPRGEYEAILARADAAIGTLSLHEKKMEEACALKVREYLAYGIPVILGHKDTDFPNGAPFILQLPNTPTNVADGFDRIEEFVKERKGKRVERKDVEHLDVGVKETERLAFFEKIISGDIK